ncbi:MAG: LytR/AlgR family response regulator transcription factor [Chitinophagales bacterium]
MEVLKCVIIEDQLSAQRILMSYISEMSNLELIGCFISPLEAIPTLGLGQIDVLFLDVHLPKISGIDFLKSLKNPPNVILTTAFTEYALKGFELDVVDYLLKPFSFERFLKSIFKIQRLSRTKAPIVHLQYLFVRTKNVIQKVKIADIHFIEAKGDFVLIWTASKRYIANSSLHDILKRLGANFARSHKSFIVNIHAIDKINGNCIQIGEHTVSIGRKYREGLMLKLKMV